MKNILSKLKEDSLLKGSLIVFMCLQPLLELDLYLQPFYAKTGILAFSTSIRILGIGWLTLLTLLRSRKPLRDITLWGVYGAVLLAYVYYHFMVARTFEVWLPSSYRWVGSYELKYILFLILPYILMWACGNIYLDKKTFNTLFIFTSLFICLNIFITNILVSSYGSYGSITYKNIFTWFTGIYDSYTPKELTSIGFFFEANPMSGALIVMFPLVVKAYLEEHSKTALFAAVIQLLTMFMIGTRVGAYGTIVVMVPLLLVYVFLYVIKYQPEFFKKGVIVVMALICLSGVILPYSPAYRNASFDYDDELSFSDNERNLADGLLALKDIDDPEEFRYALIYQLEHIYLYYITFPREYYEYYYSYKLDPEFYFDVLSLPFEQRKGGRQFEKYFISRKFSEMTDYQQKFGLGYSRMSQGGIVLEQDFLNQYYLLGSYGALITVAPYLGIFVILGLWLLWKWRNKDVFSFENLMLFMSFSLGLFISYYSGHVLDQPIVSFTMALIAGRLFYNLRDKDGKNKCDCSLL